MHGGVTYEMSQGLWKRLWWSSSCEAVRLFPALQRACAVKFASSPSLLPLLRDLLSMWVGTVSNTTACLAWGSYFAFPSTPLLVTFPKLIYCNVIIIIGDKFNTPPAVWREALWECPSQHSNLNCTISGPPCLSLGGHKSVTVFWRAQMSNIFLSLNSTLWTVCCQGS